MAGSALPKYGTRKRSTAGRNMRMFAARPSGVSVPVDITGHALWNLPLVCRCRHHSDTSLCRSNMLPRQYAASIVFQLISIQTCTGRRWIALRQRDSGLATSSRRSALRQVHGFFPLLAHDIHFGALLGHFADDGAEVRMTRHEHVEIAALQHFELAEIDGDDVSRTATATE